tara:strand:+ start:161 stop:373 length:213 start_codon:yes stop_codon:yes gene_type:complete
MDIFLAFIKKHIALKKVYDVIFSCTEDCHMDGARKLINLYIKNYNIPEKQASKIWSTWGMKKKHIAISKH